MHFALIGHLLGGSRAAIITLAMIKVVLTLAATGGHSLDGRSRSPFTLSI